MISSNTTIINPKPCNYGCNTRIYWDTSSNSYLEVFTKQKHSCPNRNNNSSYSNKNNTYRNWPNNSKKPGPRSKKCQIPSSYYLDQLQKFRENMKYFHILILNIMVKFMEVNLTS